MDQSKRVAVTGDFLFRSVARWCLMEYDFLQLEARGLNTFNSIGGFCGFNAGGFAQGLECFGCLLSKEILLAAVRAQRMNRSQVGLIETEPRKEVGAERRHRKWGNRALIGVKQGNNY